MWATALLYLMLMLVCLFRQEYSQYNVLYENNYSNSCLIVAYFKILVKLDCIFSREV